MAVETITPATPGSHRRDHRSVLATAEKRLLVYVAHRLPAFVGSDHLTLLALLAMAAAGVALGAHSITPYAAWIVVGALAVNWFGDSLDGTVARVRNQQRPRYGFYVDHVIDLLGTSLFLGGLALSGLMSPTLAVAVLAAYLLVCAESYLATHAAGVFRMSFAGFGPTELRILLAIGVLRASTNPDVVLSALGTHRLFDVGGVVAIAGMSGAFLLSAARQAHALFQAEPLPARTPGAGGQDVPAGGVSVPAAAAQ